MCNLYTNTMPQDAMRRLFKALDRLGNQEPLTAIFPDAEVPIVRIGDDGARELVKARWGWDKTPRGWVTNARNLDKSWGVIRNVRQRCLVPATSFAEYHPSETIPGASGKPIKGSGLVPSGRRGGIARRSRFPASIGDGTGKRTGCAGSPTRSSQTWTRQCSP